MRAHGYVQIIPERTPGGQARSLTIQRVTQRYPTVPLPGAIIVEVLIDVPDEIASVQTAEAALEVGVATVVLEPQPAA